MNALAVDAADQALDPVELEPEQLPPLSHLGHPVSAYLNGLAPSSRRPQLAGVEALSLSPVGGSGSGRELPNSLGSTSSPAQADRGGRPAAPHRRLEPKRRVIDRIGDAW